VFRIENDEGTDRKKRNQGQKDNVGQAVDFGGYEK
jgi:hypothetical protein